MARITCINIYNHLPEDEPWASKHVEDIKILKLNINLERVHYVGLYCVIILQCTVQKHKKLKKVK